MLIVKGELFLEKMRLGKTELMVTKTSFGALPSQRDDFPTAIRILRKAFDAGINYFDTARYYTKKNWAPPFPMFEKKSSFPPNPWGKPSRK